LSIAILVNGTIAEFSMRSGMEKVKDVMNRQLARHVITVEIRPDHCTLTEALADNTVTPPPR